jgi:hypothetical protein
MLEKLRNIHIGSALVLVTLLVGSFIAMLKNESEISIALLTMVGGLLMPQPIKNAVDRDEDE